MEISLVSHLPGTETLFLLCSRAGSAVSSRKRAPLQIVNTIPAAYFDCCKTTWLQAKTKLHHSDQEMLLQKLIKLDLHVDTSVVQLSPQRAYLEASHNIQGAVLSNKCSETCGPEIMQCS